MHTPGRDSTLECEIVTTFIRLQELADQWRRWSHGNSSTGVFQHWEWAQAFWKTYGDRVSLYTPVVYDKEIVLGILPLMRRGAKLEFLGSPHSDYNDILCEEPHAAAVIETALRVLLRSPPGWESCVLDNLPAQSRLVRHLKMLSGSLRKHLQLIFRYPSPTILVSDRGINVLDTVIKKDQLSRSHKKLQRLGNLTFRYLESREEALAHLDRFFDQHITRCAVAGRASQFLQSDPCRFYRALVDELDLMTQLRFGVLELDSRAIAYHIGFRTDNKLTYYSSAFDVNYWNYCPGDVLLRSLLQYCRQSAVHEFDFSIGDELYKYRFANAVKSNFTLYVDRYPERLKARCQVAVRCARQAVRSRPRLKRVLDSVNHRLEAAFSVVGRLGQADLWWRCVKAVRAIFRRNVWLSEEVLFYSGVGTSAGREARAATVGPAGLDVLARLSLEFPQFLNPAKWQDCRGRIKRGDRAFISRASDGMVWIFWVARRSEIAVAEIRPRPGIPVPAPALILYDIWKSPGGRVGRISPDALRALLDQCEGGLWTYCLQHQPALRRALYKAGFQLRGRMVHRALFFCFRSTRVRWYPESASVQEGAGEKIRASQ